MTSKFGLIEDTSSGMSGSETQEETPKAVNKREARLKFFKTFVPETVELKLKPRSNLSVIQPHERADV